MLFGAVVLRLLFDSVAVGAVAGSVLGLVAVFATLRAADRLVLRGSGAQPADPTTHARVHNLVDSLCAAGGIARPRLFVIDEPAPNAFSIGRSPRSATLVVTAGLLHKLSRVELEGVLAHELSHIKAGDVLPNTLFALLPGVFPGRRREPLADLAGVRLTRYPPGLIAALEKLRADDAVVAVPARAATHLWIEAPTPDGAIDLDTRIAALREL